MALSWRILPALIAATLLLLSSTISFRQSAVSKGNFLDSIQVTIPDVTSVSMIRPHPSIAESILSGSLRISSSSSSEGTPPVPEKEPLPLTSVSLQQRRRGLSNAPKLNGSSVGFRENEAAAVIGNQKYRTSKIIPTTRIRNLPRPEPDFLIRTTFLKDDLSIGKSCKKIVKGWECRDCGDGSAVRNATNFDASESTTSVGDETSENATIWKEGVDWSNDCQLAPRRGICKPLTTWDWDPRQVSMHDSTDPNEHRHVIAHYGMTNNTYEQVPCENLENCWDMTKCAAMVGQKPLLRVYGYGDRAVSLIKHAAELYPESLQWVSDPDVACLLLATIDSFDTPEQMHSQPNWNGGRNHFLWGADAYFGSHPDQPINIHANFDHASLSTAAFQDANIRLGYDIPLATMRMTCPEFHQPQLPNHTIVGRKRPMLLNFKGNIFRMPQIWWHHRYLAFEYWEQSPDIAVDVVCKLTNRFGGRKRKYDNDAYADLLLNTTFAFCPGGGSVGSYRFAEALGLGAIPVVTSEFVPPLAPEVDWSGCLIQVSEARIIDIPRIVRAIPEEEVLTRQERCRLLFDTIIGWVPDAKDGGWRLDPNRILPLSLVIWHERIAAYHAFKQQGENILSMASSRSKQ